MILSIFIVVLKVICLTKHDLSRITDSNDSNFLLPWYTCSTSHPRVWCWAPYTSCTTDMCTNNTIFTGLKLSVVGWNEFLWAGYHFAIFIWLCEGKYVCLVKEICTQNWPAKFTLKCALLSARNVAYKLRYCRSPALREAITRFLLLILGLADNSLPPKPIWDCLNRKYLSSNFSPKIC